jgi:hypothetical protein
LPFVPTNPDIKESWSKNEARPVAVSAAVRQDWPVKSPSFDISCRCGEEERLKAIITLLCIDFTRKKAVPRPNTIRSKIEAIVANPVEEPA